MSCSWYNIKIMGQARVFEVSLSADDRGLTIVSGTDIVLSKTNHIISLPEENGFPFVRFLDARLETNGTSLRFGNGDLSRERHINFINQGPYILIPNERLVGEQLHQIEDIVFWERKFKIHEKLHDSISELLRKNGWVTYEGLIPADEVDGNPENFRFARHLVVRTPPGEKLKFLALPPGVYPIDFPKRARENPQLLEKSVDLLPFNREHAFIRFEGGLNDPDPAQWWIDDIGGKDNFIKFPAGKIPLDTRNRYGTFNFLTLRDAVRRTVDGVSIYLGRVHQAHLDYENGVIEIFDQESEKHIRGVDSQRLKDMTEVIVSQIAKHFHNGQRDKAEEHLAEKWGQRSGNLHLKIKATSKEKVTAKLRKSEEKYGIAIVGWSYKQGQENSHGKQEQITVFSVAATDLKSSAVQIEPQLEDHKPDENISQPLDGFRVGDHPYQEIKWSEKEVPAQFVEFEEEEVKEDDIFDGLWFSFSTDANEVYTLRTLGKSEGGFIKVVGKENKEGKERLIVGRIKLPAIDHEVQFTEIAYPVEPSEIKDVFYMNPDEYRKSGEVESPNIVLRPYNGGQVDYIEYSVS